MLSTQTKHKQTSITHKARLLLRLSVFLPLLIIICLHTAWLYTVAPSPCGDGQTRFYRPLSSYLRLALTKNFSHPELVELSRDAEYPTGYALFGRLAVLLDAEKLFLQEPFYLSFLLFIPLAIIFYDLQINRIHRHAPKSICLAILFFSFFPTIQIALRSFSVHGFNLILSLAGIILWLRGWCGQKFAQVFCGFFFLWLSATLKHFGLWLAGSFLICLILWSILRRQQIISAIICSLLLLIFCLPWYPQAELLRYVNMVNYYQDYRHISVIALVIVLICTAIATLIHYYHHKNRPKKQLPKFFCNGVLLILIFTLTVWILTTVIMVNQQGFNSHVLFIVALGIIIFLPLFTLFRLDDEDGFWLLLFGMAFLGGAILYFARFGYNAFVWYYPLSIAAILTIKQTRNHFCLLLLTLLFGSISNFTPSLTSFYDRGCRLAELSSDQNFCSFADQPLNWQKSQLRPLRENIYQILRQYDFNINNSFQGFTKYISGPLSEQLGLFYRNYYHDFPFLETEWETPDTIALAASPIDLEANPIDLEASPIDQPAVQALFEQWLKTSYISFILVAEYEWSKFKNAFDQEEIPTAKSITNAQSRAYLSRLFWDYLQENNRLQNYYHTHLIGQNTVVMKLYVSRQIPLSEQNTWWYKTIKKLCQPVYSPRVQELFRLSSQFFINEEWEKSQRYLQQLLELAPEHQEAKLDLQIVTEKLKIEGELQKSRAVLDSTANNFHNHLGTP